MSERKCSVPLGSCNCAVKLMIAVEAAWIEGNFSESSFRYFNVGVCIMDSSFLMNDCRPEFAVMLHVVSKIDQVLPDAQAGSNSTPIVAAACAEFTLKTVWPP